MFLQEVELHRRLTMSGSLRDKERTVTNDGTSKKTLENQRMSRERSWTAREEHRPHATKIRAAISWNGRDINLELMICFRLRSLLVIQSPRRVSTGRRDVFQTYRKICTLIFSVCPRFLIFLGTFLQFS